MNKLKSYAASKRGRDTLLCFGIVIIAYIIVQAAIAGGGISSQIKGLLVPICAYVVMAISLNLTVGILGELSLGHAGFMSVGAFAGIVTTTCLADAIPLAPLRLAVAMVVAGLFAAIAGVIVGVPVLRLKGDYLAIITLAFAEIIRVVMLNIDDVLGFELTRGAAGLTGIPSYSNFLNVFLAVAIVCFLVHTMMKSRHGRSILAIRDNEIAAEATGVNTTYYKTLAFVVSAFFAGVAGGLYAGCVGVLQPANFGFMQSIEILVMVVLGGMGSMLGSVLSATVLTILPEALRAFSDYRMIAYAVVLILVMIFRPQGLLGSYDFSLSRIIERVMNRDFPWKKDKGADSGASVEEVSADGR